MTPLYIVFAPKRRLNGQNDDSACFVSEDREAAIAYANRIKQSYIKKNWRGYASRVKVKTPKNLQAFQVALDNLSSYRIDVDWASNGNSFEVETLIGYETMLINRINSLIEQKSA